MGKRNAALLALGLIAVFSTSGADLKNDFVVANDREPDTLDPAYISEAPEERLYEALFEGLVDRNPSTGAVGPGLADSWTVGPDGKTWRFHLRRAFWADGKPITASTVVGSWLRELDPKTDAVLADLLGEFLEGAQAYHEGKAGPGAVRIQAVDDETFQMTTLSSFLPLSVLAQPPFAVVPLHLIEKFGADWTDPRNFTGNGPFRLESWKPERLTVVANAKYWDAASVHLKQIVFLPIGGETAWEQYKNGTVDWDTQIPPERIQDASFLEDFQNAPTLETYYYEFDLRTKPLDDVRVRRALSQAIDRSSLVREVLGEGEFPSYSVSPGFPDYVPPETAHDNILAARKLLADAGFPDGKGFPKLTLGFNTSERHKAIALFIQNQWKANLGIEVDLKEEDWKPFLADCAQHVFGVFRGGWVGDYADPTTFLDPWGSQSPDNVGYSNPDFDRLLAKAKSLPDVPERLQDLAQAETLLLNDQPILPLFFYGSPQLINLNKWDGWYNNTANVHPWKGIGPRE